MNSRIHQNISRPGRILAVVCILTTGTVGLGLFFQSLGEAARIAAFQQMTAVTYRPVFGFPAP